MSRAAGDADTAADSGSADISRLSGVTAAESHLAQSVAKRREPYPGASLLSVDDESKP